MRTEVKEPIREAVGGRDEDLEDSLNSEGPVLVVEGTDEAVDDGEKCHSESTDSDMRESLRRVVLPYIAPSLYRVEERMG